MGCLNAASATAPLTAIARATRLIRSIAFCASSSMLPDRVDTPMKVSR